MYLSSRIFISQSLNEGSQPLVRKAPVDEDLVLDERVRGRERGREGRGRGGGRERREGRGRGGGREGEGERERRGEVGWSIECYWTNPEEERKAFSIRCHHEVLWLHSQFTNNLLEELCLTLLRKPSSHYDYQLVVMTSSPVWLPTLCTGSQPHTQSRAPCRGGCRVPRLDPCQTAQ